MLEEFIGEQVVIDMSSLYVCIGTLKRIDETFLELKSADLHDLRDTETTRENYVASSALTGVKRNRRRVLLRRSEMVAITLLSDIVDG
ncbi:MAG: hypothetical protein ACFCD0_13390 [Gemmataceae bacterium]